MGLHLNTQNKNKRVYSTAISTPYPNIFIFQIPPQNHPILFRNRYRKTA